MEPPLAERQDSAKQFGDEAARRQGRGLGQQMLEPFQSQPLPPIARKARIRDAVGVEKQSPFGGQDGLVFFIAGDFAGEGPDGRAGPDKLFDLVRVFPSGGAIRAGSWPPLA